MVLGSALKVSSHALPYCSTKCCAKSSTDGKDLVADLVILLYAQTQCLFSLLAFVDRLVCTRCTMSSMMDWREMALAVVGGGTLAWEEVGVGDTGGVVGGGEAGGVVDACPRSYC